MNRSSNPIKNRSIMKKLSFLLFAVMIVSNLSAQIEEVNAKQFVSQKDKTQDSQLNYLMKAEFPVFLGNQKYNLIGQQLYCTSNQHFAACLTNSGLLHIERLSKESYSVIDILFPGQIRNLCREFKNNKLLAKRDTVHYFQENKEKVWRYDDDDILSLMYTSSFCYVLRNKDEKTFYVRWEKTSSSSEAMYRIDDKGRSAYIGDFIALDTYVSLKEKYEGKKFVNKNYKDADQPAKYVWTVQKIGIEEGDIVFVLQHDQSESIEIYPFRRTKPTAVKTEESLNWLESFTRHDTILQFDLVDTQNDLYYRDPYKTAEHNATIFLKNEVDSILQKFSQEKAAFLAKEEADKEATKQMRIDKYGAKFANCIEEKKICIGMTKEMCKEAKGSPDNVSSSKSSIGTIEVWTYTMEYEMWNGLAPIIVVTFTNGKVTDVEEYKSREAIFLESL